MEEEGARSKADCVVERGLLCAKVLLQVLHVARTKHTKVGVPQSEAFVRSAHGALPTHAPAELDEGGFTKSLSTIAEFLDKFEEFVLKYQDAPALGEGHCFSLRGKGALVHDDILVASFFVDGVHFGEEFEQR